MLPCRGDGAGLSTLTPFQWGAYIPGMLRISFCLLPLLFALVAGAQIAPPSERGERDMVLLAGGDVAYPRGWMDRFVEQQGASMFDEVRPFALAADLAFINLETPLTEAAFVVDKRWPIATPPHRLEFILSGGFNLFSLANNHLFDCGNPGADDTLRLLTNTRQRLAEGPRAPGERRHLFWAGLGRRARDAYEPTILTVPGKTLKVAFHAFGWSGSRRTPAPSRRAALRTVRAHASEADLTVVSIHTGREYRHVPGARKARLFRRFIDAGADIVLGHHPHVIQGVEVYGGGVIFHSLGNFSFASAGNFPSAAAMRRRDEAGVKMYSMLPSIWIRDGRVVGAEIVPLYVNNIAPMTVEGQTLPASKFRPQVLEDPFASTVLGELVRWTAEIPGATAESARALQVRGERAWVQVQ